MPAAREVIAVIVTVGSFGLLGGYIFTGGHLDTGTGVGLVAFCSGSLGAVLGFYFGKTNGTQTTLANSAIAALGAAQNMLTLAGQRRGGDVAPLAPAAPAVPPAPIIAPLGGGNP